MTSLVDCPHCSTRVLPMPGRLCPACRQGVDSPPAPHVVADPIPDHELPFTAAEIREATRPPRTEDLSNDPRFNDELAERWARRRAEAARELGRKNMTIGGLWCVGGLAVTALTHQAAANAGGGKYVVAWGAVVFGGIQFIRGLIQSASASP